MNSYLCILLQQDMLNEGYQQEYPEDLEAMDMPSPNDGFAAYEDEDELLMQAAPNDTYLALQLLRSQFPAKARVGIHP